MRAANRSVILSILSFTAASAAQINPAAGDAPRAVVKADAEPAQPESAGPTSSPNEGSAWTLELHPCVWYMGMSGDVKLPRSGGNSSSVDLRDLDLNSPRIAPFGEATLRHGKWMVGFRGFAFSTEQDATPGITSNLGNIELSPGSTVRSSLDLAAVEVEGGYTLFFVERSPLDSGGFKLRTRLDAVAGVRLMSFEFDTVSLSGPGGDPTGPAQSADEFTAMPLVGARVTADFYEDFSIILEMTVGGQPFGDDWSYGFDIIVGGQWRPIQHVGAQIGYRALFLGLASGNGDDEFEFNGAAQGLYAGVTFDF